MYAITTVHSFRVWSLNPERINSVFSPLHFPYVRKSRRHGCGVIAKVTIENEPGILRNI